jgi:hypothetical protein
MFAALHVSRGILTESPILTKKKTPCGEYKNSIEEVINNFPVVAWAQRFSAYGDTKSMEESISRTVNFLVKKGVCVLLLGEVPTFSTFDYKCPLWNNIGNNDNDKCFVPRRQIEFGGDGGLGFVNDFMKSLARDLPGVAYWSPVEYICPEGICSPYSRGGLRMYWDSSHLTYGGGRLIGREYASRYGVPSEVKDAMLSHCQGWRNISCTS